MIDKAHERGVGKYIREFVAPVYQRMIRAEFGADPRQYVSAIVDGELRQVKRSIGQCVCVTCGKIGAWNSGIKGMHTGHFLAGRGNSILFEDDNVAPQCSGCNYYGSGEQQLFRKWMIAVRGMETVERLERLKATTTQFTREELVDMRIAFKARLDAAIEWMVKKSETPPARHGP